MNVTKTHKILIRGVDKATKRRLIKKARDNKRSVNSELLIAISNHVPK